MEVIPTTSVANLPIGYDVDALIHMPHEMPPEGITPSLGALIKKYRAKEDLPL